ncbi:MAG: enoyl-CoA hydratase/isomerase family protein, partial [Thermoanaerobaculia bacterium]
KANILDRAMVTELDRIFEQLQAHRELRAIVIEGEGLHFSFGASVEEHLADQIEGALARLGGLLRRVAAAPAPTIAAVRGLCLGGGFELALACDLIVAEEDAQLGAPEIKLGVFPPAAAALLPVRIGAAGAASMILTGHNWTGSQALLQGLVTRIAPSGSLAPTLEGFIEECFLPRSPAALRHATRAVRRPIRHALEEELPKLERLYLDELMRESDAEEGIRAFLEHRDPSWMRRELTV